jgi:drug/metabolite transporter (DMT)-like permease
MMQPAQEQRWHHLFPLITVLIWSGNTLVTKLSSGRIAPASITFYRWSLAFALLSLFMLPSVWRARQQLRALLPQLFTLGVLGMLVYQGLAYYAASTTTATNMGILLALSPLLSSLFASVLTDDRLTQGALVGGVVSFAGVLWLISGGQPQALLHFHLSPGDALMLVAVMANALYGVLLRRWNFELSRWVQLYVQIGCALLFLTPWFLLSGPSPLTEENLPLVLYAGTLASIGAPWLWIKGIQTLGPARASLYMNLMPVMVAVAAMWLLGETLGLHHLVGGGLALAGVWLGQTLRKPLRAAG